MNVGIRELRNHLSRHLDHVREGHTITVTDHGRPVARLVPAGAPTQLERLVGEGKVSPASRAKRARGKPVSASGTVSDLIDEQRG